MADRIPTLVPRDAIERRVIKLWRASGLVDGSIAIYLVWVRLFRARFPTDGPGEFEQFTCAATTAFSNSYTGQRRGCYKVKASTRGVVRTALRAWWCALYLLGEPVPAWRRPASPPRRSPLLTAYEEYRRSHRGVAGATLVLDMEVASSFVKSLRARGRDAGGARVVDIDAFVDQMSPRLCRRTIAGRCSSLRSFLRFLYATGRLRRDLASCVLAPRYRTDEGPPRALPWETVRRILRVIDRDRTIGRRDFAMLLLMASYGLGSSEIVHLRVDDVDWRAGVLRVRRRKTCVPLELPLLPAIGRALAAYLRGGRPPATIVREIFVTPALPHRALTTSVIRHQIREYARRAGVPVAVLGGHAFRHSHATRQIDSGAPLKIVGDILGHLRPASTSVYVRVAFERLRTVALPVPR